MLNWIVRNRTDHLTVYLQNVFINHIFEIYIYIYIYVKTGFGIK